MFCRFKCKIEYMKPDKPDPGTSVKGLDYIDVPGSGKRDYKLQFLAHKEGQQQVKVCMTVHMPVNAYIVTINLYCVCMCIVVTILDN